MTLLNDNMREFLVVLHGPKESTCFFALTTAPFEHGTWQVRVEVPDTYPYKSPSVCFKNKIYHPNIELETGSVCLDVINQTWTPMYDCLNIFDAFLPQLLRYPNPSDPLNSDAAALLLRDASAYDAKVREYVQLYASEQPTKYEANPSQSSPHSYDVKNSQDDDMSDMGSVGSLDEDLS